MNHPQHLTSTRSSAFIPFCAFKNDLSFSNGTLDLPGITFPLCSSFVPTILEGQLCYKLKVTKPSSHGIRDSLLLLLDYNEQLSLRTSFDKKDFSAVHSKKLINFDNRIESQQIESAKIHINVLSGYNGFGKGVYTMTAVKRMTSKEDFLKLPIKDRKCNIELYEDCRTRMLLEECNCVPWDLAEFQVRL